METVVLAVDAERPQADVIAQAAEALRRGEVVAFPTETVYGLGADALNEAAVERIFTAKGRPANNPLIVHGLDVAAARRLTTAWPEAAERLAKRYWPGPLTLVLPKADLVPGIVTACGPTVAVRVPAHPVARALIEATGRPLAAPSANRSTRVSATRAEHVLRGLNGRIAMVLDGGPTHAGLESTVVDLSGLTGPTPRLLRPGPIDVAELADVLGMELRTTSSAATEHEAALPSPGMLRKHYAPTVPVRLTVDDGADLVRELSGSGRLIGWIPLDVGNLAKLENAVCVPLPCEPRSYAPRLYETWHYLEERGVATIVVQSPPDEVRWAAIHDRLQRATAE